MPNNSSPTITHLIPALLVCTAVVAGLATAQVTPERRLIEDRAEIRQIGKAILATGKASLEASEARSEIQRLFRQALQANRKGQPGEARRQMYRALAMAMGREWTDRDEYWRSLLLRTDMTIHDPASPLVLRLGQIYATTYEVKEPLRLRASLVTAGARDPGPPLKKLGSFEGLPPNFIFQPFMFAADLGDVEDGNYEVVAEVFEGNQLLRRLRTPVSLLHGLAATRAAVMRRLADISGHDSAKATVRYPFELATQVTLEKRQPYGYDFKAEIERSEQLLEKLEAGGDPLYEAAGHHKRHYWFEQAREIMPYEIVVPDDYDSHRAWPLIVALHGNGGDEHDMFRRANGYLLKEAPKQGYIIVNPLGYSRTGAYGKVDKPDATADTPRIARLSELDVMNVLALVRAEYQIDDNRIYLTGGSMGGGGTWRLASKYPDIWAAAGPIAAGITPREIDIDGMRHIPVFVSHGDADQTVPVESSRVMVALMKKLGMTYEYLEIPGGPHDISPTALPKTVEFFNRHKRKPASDD